jgi:catechol 2,3-dioxygenase-like lactoylglutathione lyase family enzyme/diadenosine tetraphosphate (Ap4A) HIT family hydrolase
MNSGWAVMGQKQMLTGYSLLLPDPVVPHLNALAPAARDQFLSDLGMLGEAVMRATDVLRINYAMFGNVEPALHAHVHPRFVDEVESLRTANPWGYDWNAAPSFDLVTHGPLRDKIRSHLLDLQAQSSSEQRNGRVHHVDLTVSDLARSTRFYDRWMPRMGFRRIADCAEGPLWRGESMELGLQQAKLSTPHDRYAPGLHHMAFAAASRDAVIELHRELEMAQERVLDAPADYPQYAPGYFAVFLTDPDGIKLEYVFTT